MESADRGRAYFLNLGIKALTLIAIYSTYGVLQERIIKGHYINSNNVVLDNGEPTDRFTSAPLLVLCNRLVSLATGIVLAQIQWAKAHYSELPTTASTPTQTKTWLQFGYRQISRIRPASSVFAYAIVAGLNNAATISQYASLSYLSFTTSTLGKSAKMVPVLVIGHTLYGKRYKTRQWIGAAIVILGIWGYLASLLNIDMDKSKVELVPRSNLIGVGCLLAYLFFDGLTSTMQEKLFGQAKGGEQTESLMGITPGIIDQMIWVNFFSSIVAFWFLGFSPLDKTLTSVRLMLQSPILQLHIFLLSVTATAGLLLLFHVIATYGALMASLIMTVRQFVSIVCNAAWFGNMEAIPLLGWAGIGVMAAGIWIKMDRKWDEKPPVAEEEKGDSNAWLSPRRLQKLHVLAAQYGLPLMFCPSLFVVLIAAFEFLRQPTPVIVDAIWGINSR